MRWGQRLSHEQNSMNKQKVDQKAVKTNIETMGVKFKAYILILF